MRKSILWIIASRMLGLLCFFVVLFLLKKFNEYMGITAVASFVSFLTANIVIIVLYSLLLMLGELFKTLDFPMNFPFPIFNAAGGMLVAKFIINIFGFIDRSLDTNISPIFESYSILIYTIVMLVILVNGYMAFFRKIPEKEDEPEGYDKEEEAEPKKETKQDEMFEEEHPEAEINEKPKKKKPKKQAKKKTKPNKKPAKKKAKK